MKRIVRKLRRGEKGQDMIEFAIVLPLLVLLVMGIVDFGHAFNTWLSVTHGAREGARYAAVGRSDGEIVAHVVSTTPGVAVSVSISPSEGARVPGQPVTVAVSTNLNLFTGIIAGYFGASSFPLSSTAEMRYEGPWL